MMTGAQSVAFALWVCFSFLFFSFPLMLEYYSILHSEHFTYVLRYPSYENTLISRIVDARPVVICDNYFARLIYVVWICDAGLKSTMSEFTHVA